MDQEQSETVGTSRRMRLFVVNVGTNTHLASSRGLRSPIFPDGTFEFVPIPESTEVHGRDGILTYEDLPAWTGAPSGLVRFIPERMRSYSVHADPEFGTFTYGDVPSARGANLAEAQPGDELWFLARLWDHDGNSWGGVSDFYFIGIIRVAENVWVHADTVLSALPPALRARISQNAHYLRLQSGDTSAFRIVVGATASSMRFHRAMRVTREVAGHIYGGEFGRDGLYHRSGRVLLNKNGGPRTFERLGSITRSVQAFLDSGDAQDRAHLEALGRHAAACVHP